MRKHMFFALLLCVCASMAQVRKVWIDADTGNEIDDVYAIARLLHEPGVDVVGLSSAHFNNPDLLVFEKWNQYDTEHISTIEISQRLNEGILEAAGRKDIPCVEGADRQIGRAWGGFQPRPSEAVTRLVDCIHSLPQGERLDVICLGALTNLASAVILHPDIVPRIRCYMLGAQYDAKKGVWNKNEFNIRNDLNAFDYLLGMDSISLYVMPITTALPYRFEKEDTFKRLSRQPPALHRVLQNRWEETEATSMVRVFWDLALVEAYLHPDFSTLEERPVPPENGSHGVQVYVGIEARRLFDDFWNYMDALK